MNETTSTHGGTAADAKHYQTLTQQPIEIMQRLMTREQFLGFLHGNVVKYALRCGRKDDPAKEMEKVRQYADWYVRALGGETIDPRLEDAQSPDPRADVNPWIDCVKEFNRAYSIPTFDKASPHGRCFDSLTLQRKLIAEEFNEFLGAFGQWSAYGGTKTKVQILDALCDLIYVAIGFALKAGFDLDGAFREVHRSNMSKLGPDGKPIKHEDGKILKGPNFTPPDLMPYV